MPSITHVALVELEKAGILKFVISQVSYFLVYLQVFNVELPELVKLWVYM